MTLLLIAAVLWLSALSYTLIKRGRQLDKVLRHLKNKVYEQENKKAEGQERQAEEEGRSNDTGHRPD